MVDDMIGEVNVTKTGHIFLISFAIMLVLIGSYVIIVATFNYENETKVNKFCVQTNCPEKCFDYCEGKLPLDKCLVKEQEVKERRKAYERITEDCEE